MKTVKAVTPLRFEDRKGTDYLFVHVTVNDDRVEKTLDVYFNKKTGKYGLEVYQGQNYVVGSGRRSYSRNYAWLHAIPDKYVPLVRLMTKKLKEHGAKI